MEVEYEGEVLWTRKEKEYYTLEEACEIATKESKNIKHKDFEQYIFKPKKVSLLVTYILADTDREFFELINAKEFEVVE